MTALCGVSVRTVCGEGKTSSNDTVLGSSEVAVEYCYSFIRVNHVIRRESFRMYFGERVRTGDDGRFINIE